MGTRPFKEAIFVGLWLTVSTVKQIIPVKAWKGFH
jgi:hypothetical protein